MPNNYSTKTVNIWGRLRRNTNGSAWKIHAKYLDSLPMLELLYRVVLGSLLIGWKIYLLLIGSSTNYEFLSTNHRVWQDKVVESWNQGHHDRVIFSFDWADISEHSTQCLTTFPWWPQGLCACLWMERSGFEPWPWHCVVFFGKALDSHSFSLSQHLDV